MKANSREVVEYILVITVELIAYKKSNVIYVPKEKIQLVIGSQKRISTAEKGKCRCFCLGDRTDSNPCWCQLFCRAGQKRTFSHLCVIASPTRKRFDDAQRGHAPPLKTRDRERRDGSKFCVSDLVKIVPALLFCLQI